MTDARYRHFTQQQVEHLRVIINVLLPFQSLLPGTVNYAEKLGIVEFIDGLLTETARDNDLIARFADAAAHPLAQCPIADAIGWRERRGLNAAPVFDAPRSENMLLEGDIKPFARAEFYGEHMPPLELAISGANPQTSKEWEAFVTLLLSDDPARKTDWPHATLKKPSEFLYQLTRDALQAVLGLRNPYAERATLEAILVRLGEKRRVGNAFTTEDSQEAVEHFIALLPKPSAQAVPEGPVGTDAGPVGSPPV
jgi:hypothetical protein